jgi:ABC-type Fe3+/spermidine/putrescine transport system ATPase subunit
MLFQSDALCPGVTVFDNVAYGLRLWRMPADVIRARVRQTLPPVEIGDADEMARRRPTALSGGQQERVALARALMVEPRVLPGPCRAATAGCRDAARCARRCRASRRGRSGRWAIVPSVRSPARRLP